MTDYTITTNFGAKDSLPSGNAAKVVKGSEFTTEFTNIATAVNSKADTAGDTFTGAVTINSTATITGDLTVDTDTLFVDASTNRVGIGVDSPDSPLHVKGNINDLFEVHIHNAFDDDDDNVPNPTAGIKLSAASNNATIRCFGAPADGAGLHRIDFGSTAANSFLTFSSSDTERMRIDASGNVGIGTTNPTHPLQVQRADTDGSLGSASISLNPEYESGGGSYIRWGGTSIAGGTLRFLGVNNAERMRIDSSGNILVGTTDISPQNNNASGTASDGIALSQDGFYSAARYGGTCMVLNRMANDGSVLNFHNRGILEGYINTTQSGVSLVSVSDQRLKENITDSGDAGSTIDSIQVRQFDWIANGKHDNFGFVAQELANAVPDAVYTGEDEDETMGVDYSKLVPILVKEVQALRSRVAQLEESE